MVNDEDGECLLRLKQVKILKISKIADITAENSIYLAKKLTQLSAVYFDTILDYFDIFAMCMSFAAHFQSGNQLGTAANNI